MLSTVDGVSILILTLTTKCYDNCYKICKIITFVKAFLTLEVVIVTEQGRIRKMA